MILLSCIGLVIFIAITFTFSFKNKVLKAFFPKQASLASDLQFIPKVDIKTSVDTSVRNGIISLSVNKGPITIKWTTSDNPTNCIGHSFGLSDQDKSWDGPKEVSGGSFSTKNLTTSNPYIYSIDCSNEKGDSLGSILTVNVGVTSQTNLRPYISHFEVIDSKGRQQDLSLPIITDRGDKIKISWTTLNTNTPYSICYASGSWPTGYRNIANNPVNEEFTLTDNKIYSYNLYCSNEFGYTYQSVNFVVQ